MCVRACACREHEDGFERELAWTATELSRLEQCLPRPRRTHPAVATSAEASAAASTRTSGDEEENEEQEEEEEVGQ